MAKQPILTEAEWWVVYYDLGGTVDGPWPPPIQHINNDVRQSAKEKITNYLNRVDDGPE